MRSAWLGASATARARLSRSSVPRIVTSSWPSWSVMSAITRSFAVAVVQSTGTSAGSASSTRTMRR